mgnify:CR=1 FL=1|tara:strand:+ start:899 stop:1351 length:453 start_codon:yes stop_codon:yes gene_type:complete
MKHVFLGLDPGKSGSCALQTATGETLWFRFDQGTPSEFYDWLHNYASHIKCGLIERVSSSPQMGVVSAFSFGESYGIVQGILIGAGVSFEFIAPAKWQRPMGCMSKGDKNVTKRRAQELFPEYRKEIVHANADAILIAEYCKRKYSGLYD